MGDDMNLLCYFFGHRVPEFINISTDVRYQCRTYDGKAYLVYQPCARCRREFVVGKLKIRNGEPRL